MGRRQKAERMALECDVASMRCRAGGRAEASWRMARDAWARAARSDVAQAYRGHAADAAEFAAAAVRHAAAERGVTL